VQTPRPLILATAVLASACGGAFGSGLPPEVEGMETSEAGVAAFVRDRRHQGWLAEPAVHDSLGPHGKVRVFFNDVAVRSLQAGNATHLKGAILVKELYTSDGGALLGYALEAKVKDGPGKDTWLFFEGGPPYENNFYGLGDPTCHGCHAAGTDYVVTALPR
jgi:hypothetical protein